MPMDRPMTRGSALLSLPLTIIRHMLDNTKARAAKLGGTKKEEEQFQQALTKRVWAGIELVEAGKVRFAPEEPDTYYVGSSRPRKHGQRYVMEYAVVGDSCECPDHRYGLAGDRRCAPGGNCKHLAAVTYVLMLDRGLATIERLAGLPSTRGLPPEHTIVLDTSYSQLPQAGPDYAS
jgi:hypothetical protein